MRKRTLTGLAGLLLGEAVAFGSASNTQRAFDEPERAEQVAYVAEAEEGDSDIFLRDLKGLYPPIKIADSDGNDWDPCWSRDGKKFYFVSDRGDEGVFAVYCVDLNLFRSTDKPWITKLIKGGGIARAPSVSPDGERIAFNLGKGNWNVYVMPVSGIEDDGIGLVRVTKYNGLDLRPSWSNDEEIFFQSDRGREKREFDIYKVNIKTSEVERVTDGIGSNTHPVCSPYGDLIAFVSDRGGRTREVEVRPGRVKEVGIKTINETDIYVMSPDGNGLVRLTNKGLNCSPSWSRKGDIYFASDRDGKSGLYSVSADGKGEVKEIFDGPISNPVCSP